MKRKNTGGNLAQFYTKSEISKELLTYIDINLFKLVIEPSAGNGSFSLQIPNCKAFDIEPQHESILKQDFFTLEIETNPEETLIIGNPPFGRQSSLALKFIKKSCLLANTIAFILPLSFIKQSMQDRVPLTHSLFFQKKLNKNSFLFNNEDYDVPCVFQIWKKTETPRNKQQKETSDYFKFVEKKEFPDFWFRRVGFYAGTFGEDYLSKSEQSHYFLKAQDKVLVNKILNNLNFEEINTVGAKSISKQELIKKFNKAIDTL